MDANIIKLLRENDDEEDEDIHSLALLLEESDDEDTNVPAAPKRARIQNYVANVVPLYIDAEFKSHFRLSRHTFEILLNITQNDLKVHTPHGYPSIEPKIQLMIGLWKMATPESFRSVADRFNVGKATAHRQGCAKSLQEINFNKINLFIYWPNRHQMDETKKFFFDKTAFPGIIGCIDGTHIEIEKPDLNGDDYVSRKGYSSLQAQVVCDHKCSFISIFVRFPGSTHDMMVYKNSPLINFQNEEKYPEDTHLLGDSAYAFHKTLMVPYKDNGHLSIKEKNYNGIHSSARATVERSIGLLKGRWRSLLHCLPVKKIDYSVNFITACCILHNLCILNGDNINDAEIVADPASEVGGHNASRLTNHDQMQQAKIKRDEIRDSLPLR